MRFMEEEGLIAQAVIGALSDEFTADIRVVCRAVVPVLAG
jgi:hypothetical protein